MLSSSIIPIRAIKEYRPTKYLVENHEHPYFHMIYVVSGSLLVFCDDISIHVEAGYMITFPPHSMHMIYSLESAHSIELKFACEGEFENMTTQFSAKRYWLWHAPSQIQPIMNSIMTEAEEKHTHHIEIISCRIYDLLLQMLQNENDASLSNTAGVGSSKSTQFAQDALSNKVVHEAIAYIDEHITEKINVADIAKQLNYSHSYFSTTFKKAVGLSPQQFITLRKITTAKSLIRKNQMNISAISNYLQFCSSAAFSNAFKKYCGVTPHQYSQQVRDCAYINLTELHDLPKDNVRSIEPVRTERFFS